MTRISTGNNNSPQDDDGSETCDSRASTPDQELAPVATPTLQSSANRQQTTEGLKQSANVFSTTVTRSESLKIPCAKPSAAAAVLSSSPIRRTSCADQFVSRQQQQYRNHTVSYPRDTGRRYYIRERKDSEDLLVNLLNLRDLLLNQNVHA